MVKWKNSSVWKAGKCDHKLKYIWRENTITISHHMRIITGVVAEVVYSALL